MHRQQRGHGTELPGDAALTIRPHLDRRRARSLGAGLVLGASVALATSGAAAAHEGGEIALEVVVERVPPGGTLPIVGRDWTAQVPLVVDLVVGTTSTRLGIVTTGPDGHFDAQLRLPADAPIGPASVDARAPNGVIERAFFAIDADAPDVGTPATVAEGIDPVPFAALGIAVAFLAVLIVGPRFRRPPASAPRQR